MLNVKLAGGHLYGKQLFTWLSQVVSFVIAYSNKLVSESVVRGLSPVADSYSGGLDLGIRSGSERVPLPLHLDGVFLCCPFTH